MGQLDVIVRLLAVDATANALGSFSAGLGDMVRGAGEAMLGLQQLGHEADSMIASISNGDTATVQMASSLGLLAPATVQSISGFAGIKQASAEAGDAVAASGKAVSAAQKEYDAASLAVVKAQAAYDAAAPALLRFASSADETALRQSKLAQLSDDVSAATLRQGDALMNLTSAQMGVRDAEDAAQLAGATEAAALSNQAMAAEELATGMGALGGFTLGAGAATALTARTMGDAWNEASDLQFSLATLGVAANTAGGNMDAASQSIQKVADTSLYTTAAVGNAFETLIERGQTMQDVLDYSGQAAINMGEAMHTDAAPAADLLGIAMREFGLQANQAGHAADVLTTSFYSGIPSTDQLAQGIRQLAPVARSAGAGFEDTMSVLTLLGGAFGSGSQAATALRYMMMQLMSPTDKAAGVLSELGMVTVNNTAPALRSLITELDKSGKAGKAAAGAYDGSYAGLNALWTAASKIPGIDVGKSFQVWGIESKAMSSTLFDANGNFLGMGNAVTVLKQKLDELPSTQDKLAFLRNLFSIRGEQAAALLDTMDHLGTSLNTISTDMNKAGTAAKDAASLLDTNRGAMAALDTTWRSFMANVGMAWLPIVDNVVQSFTRLLFWLNQDAPALARFLAIALPVAVAFGAILTVVGGVTAAIAILGPILATLGVSMAVVASAVTGVITGFGLVLLVAAGVAAAVFLISSAFSALNKPGTAINSLFNGMSILFHELGGFVSSIFAPLWGALSVSFGQLGNALAFTVPFFKEVGMLLGGAVLLAIIGVISGVAQFAVAVITGVTVIVQFIVLLVTAFVNLGHIAGDVLMGLGTAWNDVTTGNFKGAADAMHGMLNNLGHDFQTFGTNVSQQWAAMGTTLQAGAKANQQIIDSTNSAILGNLKSSDSQQEAETKRHAAATTGIIKDSATQQANVQQQTDAKQNAQTQQTYAQQLSNLSNQRAALLRAIRGADSNEEAEALRHQLAVVNTEIDGLNKQTNANQQAAAKQANIDSQKTSAAVKAARDEDNEVTAAYNHKATAVNDAAQREKAAVTQAASQQQNAATASANQTDNNVTTAFNKMVNGAGAAAANTTAAVKYQFGILANSAYTWGSDAGSNFAAGIAAQAAAVGAAAGQAAAAAAAVLHHTKPDEGPMKDDDEWGGDFIMNLVNGMRGKLPDLRGAVGDIATTMSVTPQMALSAQTASSQAAGRWQPLILQLPNGKVLAEAVIDHATGKVVQSGGTRINR